MDTGQIKDDFLREEIRQGYLVTSKMKRVWQIEIELAEYIISLCQRYGLQIWAEGGTLLGAIRHRGFIPWDDDIDLAMKRDDYEKLLDIASKEVKSPYFFQSVATDLDYIRGHAQLRKLNTSAVLPNNIKARFNQGIFIDIFVSIHFLFINILLSIRLLCIDTFLFLANSRTFFVPISIEFIVSTGSSTK